MAFEQRKIPVVILGATGVVGQRFLRRLANHPVFEVAYLAASDRSTGKKYSDACTWHLSGEPYAGFGDMVVCACDPGSAPAPVAFSALDADAALRIEAEYARSGAFVFSNASAYRMDPTVPLLIPELNSAHLGILERQRAERGWKGAIVTNPNCTTVVLAGALAPLDRAFGIEAVMMTSMQAISGAGYPGVSAMDIMGNVIPPDPQRGAQGRIRAQQDTRQPGRPRPFRAAGSGPLRRLGHLHPGARGRRPYDNGFRPTEGRSLRPGGRGSP